LIIVSFFLTEARFSATGARLRWPATVAALVAVVDDKTDARTSYSFCAFCNGDAVLDHAGMECAGRVSTIESGAIPNPIEVFDGRRAQPIDLLRAYLIGHLRVYPTKRSENDDATESAPGAAVS